MFEIEEEKGDENCLDGIRVYINRHGRAWRQEGVGDPSFMTVKNRERKKRGRQEQRKGSGAQEDSHPWNASGSSQEARMQRVGQPSAG